MRIERPNPSNPKGWFAGPWDSDLAISIGYTCQAIDDPHMHSEISEVYLVAQGTCNLRVEKTTVTLRCGDVVIIAPGEAHTFLSNSPDYLHFVVHTPGLSSEQARVERIAVGRERLGL
jgi:mannose-6-phosphate isomerase-like protein (cupin superfamily)